MVKKKQSLKNPRAPSTRLGRMAACSDDNLPNKGTADHRDSCPDLSLSAQA